MPDEDPPAEDVAPALAPAETSVPHEDAGVPPEIPVQSSAGARSRRRGSKDPPEEKPPEEAEPVSTLQEPAPAVDSGLRNAAAAVEDEQQVSVDAVRDGALEPSIERPVIPATEVMDETLLPLDIPRHSATDRIESQAQDSYESATSKPVGISGASSQLAVYGDVTIREVDDESVGEEGNEAVATWEEWDNHEDPDDEEEDNRLAIGGQDVEDQALAIDNQESEDDESLDDDDPMKYVTRSQILEEDEPPLDSYASFMEMEQEAKEGMVQINTNTMLSFLCFVVLWVFSAAAFLLALTWHYVWVEVEQQATLAARSAVDHGGLHTSEVLSPATAVLKTLDLGFRGGSISDVGDYEGFYKVLEPFFQALPYLRDVEIADTPEYATYVSPGSVLASRSLSGEVELLSDRGDCSTVAGSRGCVLESHRANGSSWFDERLLKYPHRWNPMPLGMAWDGPSFSRDLPHEAICDELCWSPTYSVSARISGGLDPQFVFNNRTYDHYRSSIVRVTMEATVFIDVLREIQMASRGEAFVCTASGVIIAAVDMADTQTSDAATGVVRMAKAWEYPRDWSVLLDASMVSTGDGQKKLTAAGDYLVSAWVLDSPHNATTTLSESLRVVIAIPTESFADSVIQSLRYWFITTSVLPVAFVTLGVIFNVYLRFFKRGERQLKNMTIQELQEITRQKKDAILRHKAREEQLRLSAQLGKMKSKSTVARMGSWIRSSSGRSLSPTGRSSSGMLSRTFSRGSSRIPRMFSFRKKSKGSSSSSPAAIADGSAA